MLCLSLVVMRSQPLRRALCALEEVWNNLIVLSVI
ncbi:acetyltransferase [Vibrio cholerae]|nr:acetyltransferase [Vibrio cholerae]EGR0757233.1 acetyltransferase [Vibrio cholerae]EGR0820835.1 acetyltransferase [Vibrio cholerae]